MDRRTSPLPGVKPLMTFISIFNPLFRRRDSTTFEPLKLCSVLVLQRTSRFPGRTRTRSWIRDLPHIRSRASGLLYRRGQGAAHGGHYRMSSFRPRPPQWCALAPAIRRGPLFSSRRRAADSSHCSDDRRGESVPAPHPWHSLPLRRSHNASHSGGGGPRHAMAFR